MCVPTWLVSLFYMPSTLIRRLTRGVSRFFRMHPGYAVLRLEAELWRHLDRRPPGRQEEQLDVEQLLRRLGQPDLEALERTIAAQGVPYDTNCLQRHVLDQQVPPHSDRIIELANLATNGWVDILGSGPVQLGNIDWARDYKSGLTWPFIHYTQIDTSDLERPSDVKYPWDLSRLHWLLPVAQAYRLTNEERYAEYVRYIIEHWMAANPCGWGVNWACTMEPAMRVFSWTWLYRNLHCSASWQRGDFRFRMLRALYLHLQFIRRNIEVTDINGNHLIADVSALVVGGSFFGGGVPQRWQALGWRILLREIHNQVLADGVDFEASVPYHRLVAELFFLAAATMEENGVIAPSCYVERLLAMAKYIRSYSKPDGSAPVIGDADDARALPLGMQHINDHRYLPFLIVARWAPDALTQDWHQSASECLWWWGRTPINAPYSEVSHSEVYLDSGNAILRSEDDYIFIDSGILGLSGRGGHGHNDCLSFEATLLAQNLVIDPGCPTYTGDWCLRNEFRSTSVHNTPALEGEEINRFVSPRDIWSLHDDTRGVIEFWHDDPKRTMIRGSHQGYSRLDPRARVRRALLLDKFRHAISWEDSIEGVDGSRMKVPLQLAPCVENVRHDNGWVQLRVSGYQFVITWLPIDGWELICVPSRVSVSYGVLCRATRLEWRASSPRQRRIRFFIYPGDVPVGDTQAALCLNLEEALLGIGVVNMCSPGSHA